jgi:hypothetical protein
MTSPIDQIKKNLAGGGETEAARQAAARKQRKQVLSHFESELSKYRPMVNAVMAELHAALRGSGRELESQAWEYLRDTFQQMPGPRWGVLQATAHSYSYFARICGNPEDGSLQCMQVGRRRYHLTAGSFMIRYEYEVDTTLPVTATEAELKKALARSFRLVDPEKPDLPKPPAREAAADQVQKEALLDQIFSNLPEPRDENGRWDRSSLKDKRHGRHNDVIFASELAKYRPMVNAVMDEFHTTRSSEDELNEGKRPARQGFEPMREPQNRHAQAYSYCYFIRLWGRYQDGHPETIEVGRSYEPFPDPYDEYPREDEETVDTKLSLYATAAELREALTKSYNIAHGLS